MKKAFSLFIIIIFLLVLGGVYKFFVHDYGQEISYETPVTLVIPPKTSAKAIGILLEQTGVIYSQTLFYWSVRLRQLGGQLRSGEYAFPMGRSMKSVIQKLLQGDIVYHRLTLAEGLTSRDIKALLEGEQKLKGPVTQAIPEGSLLPETYTFFREESRQNLIFHMQKAMSKTVSDLWERYKERTPLKSKEEVVILASIVEKETSLAKERSHIAAVFLNRLRKGMPLQTDPTVIYALELREQKTFERSLTREDLKVNSPYNTYLIKGLPPAPICHPGKASLEAVLNPLESDDLFFVADGTGGHVFSETYKEHARNHVKWRQIKKEKKRPSS